DLVEASGHVLPAVEVLGRGEPPQRGRGLDLGGPLAALLGALPLGRAPHAVEPRAGLEDEVDEALLPGLGEARADALLARRGARDVPVERVDDRVDDRRLARARGSLEQEQATCAERGEVDLVLAREGADPGEAQAVELHQALLSAAATASTAARSTAASASLAWRPVTCLTKSPTTLTGSLAGVTATSARSCAAAPVGWWRVTSRFGKRCSRVGTSWLGRTGSVTVTRTQESACSSKRAESSSSSV